MELKEKTKEYDFPMDSIILNEKNYILNIPRKTLYLFSNSEFDLET
jgi:hypothetical protein